MLQFGVWYGYLCDKIKMLFYGKIEKSGKSNKERSNRNGNVEGFSPSVKELLCL